MNYPLIWNIAQSLSLARWKQTLVAAVGVMFSITMFIALLGFMNGLNDLLDSLVLNRTPHVRLFNEIKANENQPILLDSHYKKYHNFIRSIKPNGKNAQIANSAAIISTLKKDNRVLGISPKMIAQVFFNVGETDVTGVVNGIDVEAEARLFSFGDYVTSGSYMDLKNIPNSIILGKGLADKMLANIGDVVQVTTAKGDRFPLKVVGYFQSGLGEIDKVQSYTSLKTAQKLIGQSNAYVTDIQIKLYDLNMAPSVSKEYAQIFSTDAEDIQTANAQFETGSSLRSLISYAVGITLLIVAGFGIYNILNMLIYEKMDTIAILKATGFSGSDVKKIFITIAISIGILGGCTGLFFGFLLSLLIDNVPFKTAALPTISTYPVNYDLKYYLIGITFSLITTYLAGLFPARKASKIDPVDIIRGK
ncbi:FtsX-like permease family protein [Emticicia sp. ODNR4P]|jgi:lipoprotein-releasing system permease protein|nr:FtsX-like permease family protein [Emticicia sp. ODNR4P]